MVCFTFWFNVYSITEVFSFSTVFLSWEKILFLLIFSHLLSLLSPMATCLIIIFLIQIPWRKTTFCQLSFWGKVVNL